MKKLQYQILFLWLLRIPEPGVNLTIKLHFFIMKHLLWADYELDCVNRNGDYIIYESDFDRIIWTISQSHLWN